MRASVVLPSSGTAVATTKIWAARVAEVLERRRWWVIGLCIIAQWAFVAWEALVRIPHNGWLFQNGDDGPWYWTTAWTLTSLHMPNAAVGLAWPYVLTPLAAIFGPNTADGLPAVIALNLLVLAPAAVVGMYLLGERIAGRLFGLWTAALWVLAPIITLVLYTPRTLPQLVGTFFPTGLGLNPLSDYPSMVCAIFAAYLLLRALDTNAWLDGALCGIVLGFLVLLKPANGPLPLVGVIVLALSFRFRALIALLGAMVPGVLALTIWKRTGVGFVPALKADPHPAAGGTTTNTGATGATHRYVNIDWHHISQNLHALGQVFWSVRLLEFLLLAGAVGLVARSRAKGLLILGWFAGFALIKGGVSYAGIYDTSFYRFILPAWPAWVLLVAGTVFCWPSQPAKRARQHEADKHEARRLRPPSRTLVLLAGVILALGPLALAIAASPVGPYTVAQMNYTGAPVAVVDFGLQAKRVGPHTVQLSWLGLHTGRAKGWYQVFKGPTDGCVYLAAGAKDCLFRMPVNASTSATTFIDRQAFGRHIVYRVGLAAGKRIDPNTSSYLLLSPSLTLNAR
jgi:hypothetical protein